MNNTNQEMEMNAAAETALFENSANSATLPMPIPAVRTAAGTINALVDLSCAQYSAQPALGFALDQPVSYGSLHKRILALALRLRQAGVEPGDRVALLGDNAPNWVIAFLAVLRLGAQAVPLFPNEPEAGLRRQLVQCGCATLFLDQPQIGKMHGLKQPPDTLIALDNSQDAAGLMRIAAFDDFMQEGFALLKSENQEPFPEVMPDEAAAVLHTLGTGGATKAVVLSHAGLCAAVQAAAALMPLAPGMAFVSTQPLAHACELVAGLLTPLLNGCRIAYAADAAAPAVLLHVCAYERPHVLLVSPAGMDRIYRACVLSQQEKNRLVGFFCRFDMARKFFFRKTGLQLLGLLGGRLQVLGISGGSLNPEIEDFLREAAIPYQSGYGLTEAAPLITGGPAGDPGVPAGSAGRAVPGVQLRIVDPDPDSGVGEIQIQGACLMQGYLNDPEGTEAALTADGWLHTGDLGRRDEAGNLFVCGRISTVIALANGENIHPEALEHKVRLFPVVEEALVRENNGILEALVYPDYEWLTLKTRGDSAVKRQEHLKRLLGEMRRDVNETLPVSTRISRVLERTEPFLKTATGAIRRSLY